MITKLKVFDFEYDCVIRRNHGDIEVVGYNSPYSLSQDNQSLDDIKTAINEYKIIDKSKLESGKNYNFKFVCKFIQNPDKTFDQLFILKEIK